MNRRIDNGATDSTYTAARQLPVERRHVQLLPDRLFDYAASSGGKIVRLLFRRRPFGHGPFWHEPEQAEQSADFKLTHYPENLEFLDLMEWSAPVLTTNLVMIKGQADPSMQISTIGIEIGKSCFHVVGFDARGGIVVRRQCLRTQLIRELAKVPPCLVGMAACCGAHHLGRILVTQGHDVRLIPPQFVKPFVKVAEE